VLHHCTILHLIFLGYHTFVNYKDLIKQNYYSGPFEECVRSILKARTDLQVLENMNGLYVVYIERVIGRLSMEVAPAAHHGKLDQELFTKLLC
jgi:hypothetical protein